MMKASVPMHHTVPMPSGDAEGAAMSFIEPQHIHAAPIIDEGHMVDVTHLNYANVTGGGQEVHDNQLLNAPSKPKRAKSHRLNVPPSENAQGAQDGNHLPYETQRDDVAAYSIISALWRQRYAWVKSRTSMNLAAQARCRAFAGGDKAAAAKLWKAYQKGEKIDQYLTLTILPYSQAIAFFDENIKPVEKQLAKLVKELPCYDWMNGHRGIGDMYIAGIFGECNGPITKSHSVSALWKFFGLAVYDGKPQAFQTDAEENKRQSYSARRRSLIAQIEDGFIMASNLEYKAIYEERKAYEMERGVAKGHAHNRAKRYMSKRFLQKLYAYAQTVESSHSEYPPTSQSRKDAA